MFWATVKGLDDIVELLIWNGANLTSRNRTGCTPLHAACDGNQLEIARFVSSSYKNTSKAVNCMKHTSAELPTTIAEGTRRVARARHG